MQKTGDIIINIAAYSLSIMIAAWSMYLSYIAGELLGDIFSQVTFVLIGVVFAVALLEGPRSWLFVPVIVFGIFFEMFGLFVVQQAAESRQNTTPTQVLESKLQRYQEDKSAELSNYAPIKARADQKAAQGLALGSDILARQDAHKQAIDAINAKIEATELELYQNHGSIAYDRIADWASQYLKQSISAQDVSSAMSWLRSTAFIVCASFIYGMPRRRARYIADRQKKIEKAKQKNAAESFSTSSPPKIHSTLKPQLIDNENTPATITTQHNSTTEALEALNVEAIEQQHVTTFNNVPPPKQHADNIAKQQKQIPADIAISTTEVDQSNSTVRSIDPPSSDSDTTGSENPLNTEGNLPRPKPGVAQLLEEHIQTAHEVNVLDSTTPLKPTVNQEQSNEQASPSNILEAEAINLNATDQNFTVASLVNKYAGDENNKKSESTTPDNLAYTNQESDEERYQRILEGVIRGQIPLMPKKWMSQLGLGNSSWEAFRDRAASEGFIQKSGRSWVICHKTQQHP